MINVISDVYTPKQIEVLRALQRNDWRLMINYGAVRAGKTVVDNDAFLMELRRVRKQADIDGVSEPLYILAGYSSKSLQNNVLQELTNKYGLRFKFDKHNSFKLFGVKIVQTFTGSIAGLGAIRGSTAYGAYVNEASLAVQEVFEEILNRCSAKGARVIGDTNPDVPTHYLKVNYIDNTDPKAGIISFHFTMDDNTFLDPVYIERKKAGTPSGMFYDRSILGLWASSEGMVYQDFDKNTMLVSDAEVPNNLSYYAGVDWGYEHKGSIVVLGDDRQGNTYLVREYTAQHQEIDYWVSVAKRIKQKYGDIIFWADSARPEHVARFRQEGFKCYNAKKDILSGIESVATLIKQGKFKVNQDKIDEFLNEIYMYVWDEKSGLPVKLHDDVMDAMRYAVYNAHLNRAVKSSKRPRWL